MTFSRIVSIFFGAGLMRPAPGTWGSVAAVAVGLILYRIGHFPLLAAATVVVTALGFWACGRELAGRPGEDPSEIVIDEVAGQWVALLFPAFGFWYIGLDSGNFPYPGWVAAFCCSGCSTSGSPGWWAAQMRVTMPPGSCSMISGPDCLPGSVPWCWRPSRIWY